MNSSNNSNSSITHGHTETSNLSRTPSISSIIFPSTSPSPSPSSSSLLSSQKKSFIIPNSNRPNNSTDNNSIAHHRYYHEPANKTSFIPSVNKRNNRSRTFNFNKNNRVKFSSERGLRERILKRNAMVNSIKKGKLNYL